MIIFLLAAILIFPPFAFGDCGMGPGPGVKSYAVAAGMCPAADATLLCETFDTNPGYDNTWTESGADGTSTINPDNTNAGTFYCDTSVHSLKMTRASAATLSTFADITPNTTSVYALFRFKLTSESLTTTKRNIFTISNDAGTSVATLALYKDTNVYFAITHRDIDGNTITTNCDAAGAISTGTWYPIVLSWKHAQASNGIYAKINGTTCTPATTSTEDHASYDAARIYFYAFGNNQVYEVDNLKVNTASEPSCN
jgi:hypothetical protein